MQLVVSVILFLGLVLGGSYIFQQAWQTWLGVSTCKLRDLSVCSDAQLQDALLAILHEHSVRAASALTTPAAQASNSLASGLSLRRNFSAPLASRANFKYVHKHTYASSDPKAAAYFMAKYFGGWCNHEPGHGIQHTHCHDAGPKPMTWNVYYNPTLSQPHGFSIHFVKNPRKLPHGRMSEWDLAHWLETWRGNFSATGRFDQFMDNHLGLVFDNLDPLVEQWEKDGVPFICRTWCCGPGMPQWPDRCPKDRDGSAHDQTDFCEQGCYVEVPHGIIIEAICGLDGYNASRKCLSRADDHLKVFDLCTDN